MVSSNTKRRLRNGVGAALFLVCCLSASGQLTLNSGDSYIYQFDSLHFDGHVTFGVAAPFGAFYLPVSPSALGPTDSLRFEMFENSPSEGAIFSRTLTSSSQLEDNSATIVNAWGDVQGAVRLTMLSGTVTINVFTLEAVTGSVADGFDVFGERIYPVPEPSPLVLSSIGCVIGLLWIRHHQNRKRYGL